MLLCAWFMPTYGENFQAKDFSYLIQKMPNIDSKLLQLHFKLYEGYVTQVNNLNSMLSSELNKAIDGQPFTFQAIKKQYAYEYDGMVLHELYFENLGGDGKLVAASPLAKKIQKQYKSFDAWKVDFEQTCLVRAIGWVILCWDPATDTLKNVWIDEHSKGELVLTVPLLVVDLWEHAYLCQFGSNRKQYLETLWKYINWSVVNSRLNK